MGKGRKENLIVSSELAPEKRKEIARKGAYAAAAAKRRKKTMREALEMMLFKTELSEQTKQMLMAEGVKDADDFNHQMVITRSLIAKAESGDVQAYHAICSMIGEKPAEKVEVGGDLFSNIRVVDDTIEDTGAIPQSEDDIPD
jgi:hypothetical protein